MPRFFVDKEIINEDVIVITGEDSRHISRSLRMRVGEMLTVCDKDGTDLECEIVGFTNESVSLKIVSRSDSVAESPVRITLFQGIPKGDKMDLIVQKATECGVSVIYPVQMKNCIASIKDGSEEKKTARWQRIADEAAKQSQRGRLVKIENPISYERALEIASRDAVSFICNETENMKKLPEVFDKKADTLSFIVGPEGGFDVSETKRASDAGIASVSLGKRILRTETASLFVLSSISVFYELM